MFNHLRINNPVNSVIVALGLIVTLNACGESKTPPNADRSSSNSAAQTGTLLKVSDANVRGLLPGRSMTAAYFTLTNNKPTAITLKGAKSVSAGAVEMHTVEMQAEQMRMRPLTEVVIASGQSATFASGGHHLMLFNVEAIDEFMTITLLFGDGTELPVEFSKVDIAGRH
ncbi:MAG: copper(I)-binding protein [Candidatus Azotimanducaceae bacterium]|jgi:copper(I)-binding protein|tara:strand:+ start:58 stop:567 length:510 start_codon:yes stop_codon:yes gene_type:complete